MQTITTNQADCISKDERTHGMNEKQLSDRSSICRCAIMFWHLRQTRDRHFLDCTCNLLLPSFPSRHLSDRHHFTRSFSFLHISSETPHRSFFLPKAPSISPVSMLAFSSITIHPCSVVLACPRAHSLCLFTCACRHAWSWTTTTVLSFSRPRVSSSPALCQTTASFSKYRAE